MAHDRTSSGDLFVPIGARQTSPMADIGLAPPRFFPPATATTPEGMLAIGGQLSPDWLLDAYGHGIFPWPFSADDPIVWWSPNPRAILEFDALRISRRLERTIRSAKFTTTCDRDFADVIRGCATANGRDGETWLTPQMIAAYEEMHHLGYAHSIEVWRHGNLVGGTYGIAIGGLFAAESMFYRVSDASKVAVVRLVRHLQARGFQLLDVQQTTPHTSRLGVSEIPRDAYLRRLAMATQLPVAFGVELEP